MKKILIYGGAFDPPHKGHEHMFALAVQTVQPDLALLVPSAVSPHKNNAATPFADRMVMSRVFKKAGDAVRVSGMENIGRHQKSYTLRTVKRVRKKYPESELYLLVGSDMLLSFHTWHLYRRLLAAVTLVVATREDGDRPQLEAAAARLRKEGGRVTLMQMQAFECSSTDVRKKLAAGESVEGLVSDEVLAHIRKRGLYGKGGTKA